MSCSLAALFLATCGRQNRSTPQSQSVPEQPQAAIPPSQGGTNLTAAMSDDQILRALGLDLTKTVARVTQGKDGYSTEYSVGEDRVTITRSLVSGVSVIRSQPQAPQAWYLGKP